MDADPNPDQFRTLMLADEPTFADILSCVFDIQQHESTTYLTLLDNPASTAANLAPIVDRDRSNVARSLTTLCEKELASRERQLLDGGGHVYLYTATPLDEAKVLMHETLDAWAVYVHERIDEYGEREMD
jgi:predicted transcriptional regulator